MTHDRYHDSAGVPWEGRSFQDNSWSGDDGSAPLELTEILTQTTIDIESLVSAIGRHRLLIPLVAHLGAQETGPHGLTVDKSADLAIVAVKTPDGKTAIPAFTSAAQLTAWKSEARPVPVDARKIALACASEGHERLVIDPAGRTVVLRRPALAALAQGLDWQRPDRNAEVILHVKSIAAKFPQIFSVDLFDGDPANDLSHAELQIQLGLRSGLSPDDLKQLLTSFTDALQTESFQAHVDSITLKLVMI